MNTIKYYFSIGIFFIKLNLQRQLEYPAFLVGWFLSNAFQFLTGIAAIFFVVKTFNTVNGWSFEQIAFMYGLGVLSHALSIILFIQSWFLDWLVVHGEFDRMLLRPANVFFQFLFYTLNLIGLTDMLPGLIIFIYAAVNIGFEFSFFNIVKILLTVIGATLIRGSLYTLSACIGFWTKRSNALTGSFGDLFSTLGTYPMSIYGRLIQFAFTFLIPVGFITFYPASEMLNKDTGFTIPLGGSLISFLVGVFLFLLTYLFFNRGLKSYESSGS